MYPFYLGIDLHLKRTYMVLMNAKYMLICESPSLCSVQRRCNPHDTRWTHLPLNGVQEVGGMNLFPLANI